MPLQGFNETIEKTNADKILNVADFISSIGMAVQELPMNLKIATKISGVYNTVIYYFNGEIVAKFGYEVPNETIQVSKVHSANKLAPRDAQKMRAPWQGVICVDVYNGTTK